MKKSPKKSMMEHMKSRINPNPPKTKKAYPRDATNIQRKGPYPEQPKYTYKGTTKFNKEDSAMYKRGFKEGLKHPVKPSRLGAYRTRGISDRYNEGFSEGKDVATVKKGSKGLSAYEKAFLKDYTKSKKKN